jgi:hypothetical protein
MKATLNHPFRIAALLLVLAASIVPTAPATAQPEPFIAGYTDFPNHLRVHSIFDEARKTANG